jgi:2-polyprenyl-3-methyl-5-hydroxy-6-metoxy-1,4-benzoquinol methylase
MALYLINLQNFDNIVRDNVKSSKLIKPPIAKANNMDTSSKKHQSNVSNKAVESSYGDNYLKWMNWGNSSDFGKITKYERTYFTSEIMKTNRSFPAKSNVLEIGFGNGSFLTYAKEKQWNICGTELNEDLVKTAIYCGFKVSHSDNLLAYGDNTFDLIVAFDVLEHIPQNVLTDFIVEIKRILKNNGFFIARFPNGDSPFGLSNQNGDITHITTIGSGKVSYFAAQSNMEVTYLGGESQPLFGTSALIFTHRLISIPIKKILQFITNIVFFPRSKVVFYSMNLTAIFKKV